MRALSFALSLALIGLASLADAQPRQPRTARAPEPLTVHIEQPLGGVIDGELVTALEARVSDASVRTAMLTVNGATYEVPVEDGRITQNVVTVPGNNRVALSVSRGGVTASDALTFHLRGPRVELVVLLGWASHGEIIDLWTREPSGEICKWDHRETNAGGRLLDFSQNAIGFGSQGYVLPEVRAGAYRIKLHYWSARTLEDDRGRYTWDEAIAQLDTLDERLRTASPAERDGLLREHEAAAQRLDRWAQPAAPQMPVHAEAVLFPNSAHERRWRFDRIVQRTGQLETLGEIEVSAAMIRVARAEVAR